MSDLDQARPAGEARPRRLLGMLPTVAVVLLALVGAWFLWPSSLGGCTTLTIVSGHSMDGTYRTGDLVISRCGPAEVGDVIVYQPADMGGVRIIHRVVGGSADEGWVVQGDNNAFTDPWTPRGDEVVGVARVHVGGAGALSSLFLSPIVWVSLLLVAAGILCWPAPQDDDEPDPDGAA
ncbi:S24/S26 family peptidase [Cellulomonas xylanilytica]|uniref:Signal peptidase I n=1 Tax=Cellulomonas xylanilytica TaxID=233583 RepID=A0A510V8Y3_9CELL|nr:S24/S26 family peptidase [Cellulomonas xylanilytica]GEK23334.1 hypothetical protein CXY01_38540 [Cellulomonas xylanilytica]